MTAKKSLDMSADPWQDEYMTTERTTRMMYVFDPREEYGYLCRVPAIIARAMCRVMRRYDYAETEMGVAR